MKYLPEKGWVESHNYPSTIGGCSAKIRTLKVPAGNILDIISREKQDELKTRMEMIRKVRNFA